MFSERGVCHQGMYVSCYGYNFALFKSFSQIIICMFTILHFRYISQPPSEVMIVEKSVDSVRPQCVAAVLRNLTFTQEVYNSFILLQDKLHQNIGRERSLVSIGTHDLDTISGPFKYQALPPQDIKFQALKETEVMTAPQMFEKFKGTYLKPYLQV